MLLPKPLVLASRSPRRLHLLRQIGIEAHVAPCDVEETFRESEPPAENARRLALEKAVCVAPRYEDAFILGADTIVTVNGTMLGKPESPVDAIRMLELLSGRAHTVHTGIALVDSRSGRSATGVEETAVFFRLLPRGEIEEYVRGGSPLDKAGAYGIQDDYGAVFVRRIEGCYYNVVGLPLARLHEMMNGFLTQTPEV